ncbi:MAG TPA: MMPL family transporter [Oligoflexia bacterium]|nr:MMPL family transporter [Oligoflexia bacterium]HMR24447.1 MMPL family transporter [Oligoflexia bacterium]
MILVQKLKINSDFKFLLPQNKPSVLAMDLLQERRQESTQLLSIVLESDDKDLIVDSIDTLVPVLKRIDSTLIKKVNYTISDAKDFYDKNKYLYLDLEDLKTIRQRLNAKIRYEKLKNNPLFFDLEDNEVEFDISDIEEKYKNKDSQQNKYSPDQFYKGYFFSKQQDYAIIIIQPSSSISGIASNEKLIKKVDEVIEQTIPKTKHKNLSIKLSGSLYETVFEYKTLIRDMLSTLTLCLSLVFLILFIYFLNVRIVLFLVIPLVYSVLTLMGIAYFCFDYLTSITVFLMSIIVGNGVNTGILLLSAYFSFSKNHTSKFKAFLKATDKTVFSTFFSAITTSLAFLCLYFSEINSLRQFGIVGSIGIFLAWAANFMILPLFIFNSSTSNIQSKTRLFFTNIAHTVSDAFANLIQKRHVILAVILTLFLLSTIKPIINYLPNSLEYDFSKLRNKTSNPIFKKANNIFKEVNPTVALFDKDNQAFCDDISNSIDSNDPDNLLDRCESIYSFLPTQQDEKLVELKKIKTLLNDKSINFLNKKEKKDLVEIKQNLSNIKKIAAKDLPELIKSKFKEDENTYNTIAYLYPIRSKLGHDSKNLVLYTQDIKQRAAKIGDAIVAGQSFILADLIAAIKKDAPKTTLLSLLVILFIIIVFLRRQLIMYMAISVVSSFLLMLFAQVMFDIKFNFINFVALPISFGIGIDYAINFFYQLSQRQSNLSQIIQNTGSAIIVCSMTTIVSYLSLISANSQALASFGKLALIGEFASLFVVFVALPSYYFLLTKKKQ